MSEKVCVVCECSIADRDCRAVFCGDCLLSRRRAQGRARNKDAYLRDPEKIKARCRAQYHKYKDRVKATNARWAAANADKKRQALANFHIRNPDAARKYARKRQAKLTVIARAVKDLGLI